jgi:outer membrane protein W
MKNYLRFLPIVTVMLSLFYCITLFAQETQQRWHDTGKYFLRAGYSLPTEEKYTGGPAVSLGKTLPLIEKLNLEIEGIITTPQSEFLRDDAIDSIGTGNLTLISANLNLDYYFISSPSFGLYLKTGVGYSFNEFSPTGVYEDLGFTIEEELDNSIQFIFGAGADFPLSDNIILNLDIRYNLNSTSGTWTTRDEISGAEVSGVSEADLNFITVMLGIKIN